MELILIIVVVELASSWKCKIILHLMGAIRINNTNPYSN